MNVPMELPRLARMTTSRIRDTLFCQKPFTLKTSVDNDSKSATFGRFMVACTIPTNQPAASNGFRDVSGAATKAVRIANGCAHAISAPRADKEPFQIIQLNVCCQ